MSDGPAGASRDLVALPRAAVLLLWTAAYLRGDLGPDDAAELAYGADRSGPAPEGEDLFDWMTGLRRLPLAQPRLVLPVPGRIAGLVGPPSAITAALGAEQAVVVTAGGIADHTLVPVDRPRTSAQERGHRIAWIRTPAPPGAPIVAPPVGGAARSDLLRALREAAGSSIDLDLVPDEPVELARVPATWTVTALPRHLDGQDAHLLVLAARTLLLADSELAEGPGAAPGLAEQQARREILTGLREAGRAALGEAVERVIHAEA